MQKVLYERKNRKIQDSIEYILNADKKEFNEILKVLRNPKGVLDFLYKEEKDNPDMTQEMFEISFFLRGLSKIDTSQIGMEQKNRIQILQTCRTKDILEKIIGKEYKLNKKEVAEIFSVLEGNESLSELTDRKKQENKHKVKLKSIFSFLKSRKNKALPEGENSIEEYYFGIMERIIYGDYNLQFFLQKHNSYAEVFNLIKDRRMAEKDIKRNSVVIGKEDEPDWKINDELKKYVYKDMPEDLSSEEKAVWIYMKLCETLQYDDSRIFEDKDNKININLLENVKPKSKVICFDFARLYAKFINSMQDDNIEAKVVGGKEHFFVEVVSKDIIMSAEATGIIANTNEFFKVKMGVPIEGIHASYDPKGIVQELIKKFTPIIYKDVHTIKNYIDMLDTIRAEETEKDTKTEESELYNKLTSLEKTMQENNVSGTEAIMGTRTFAKLGFFGDNIENVWIKKKAQNREDGIKYKSCIVVGKGDNDQFCILDSECMKVLQMNREDLLERFKNGEYSYKDTNHVIKALKSDLSISEETTNQREENIEK